MATFVSVVRHGTLAAAARELGVPKSTVSRRLARLEERLTVQLVHRAARSVVATSEGVRLFERVSAAVDTIELAARDAIEGASSPRGTIRITAPTDFGRLILLEHLQTFGTACPEISIEVDLTDRFVDLVREGFDLAIRAGRSPSGASAQNLMSRRLMDNVLRLTGNAQTAAGVHKLGDLAQCPFVLFRQGGGEATLELQTQSGRRHDVQVQGRFMVHDYSSMVPLITRGAGLGLLPDIHVRANPSLVPVLPQYFQPAGGILIVYPSKQIPRRVSLLIDHLTRAVSQSHSPSH